jgi:hypothetical protein
LFSPSPIAFDCELRFQDLLATVASNAESLLLWDGLPGQSFGAMDAASPFQPHQRPYRIRLPQSPQRSRTDSGSQQAAQLEDFKLPIATSRSLRADWWSFSPPAVQSELRQQSGGYLAGTIENPFDADLRDCALLYDRWYYKLGLVEANATIRIDDTMSPTSLKSELIGRVVQKDSHTIAPWQQSSFNVPRIMQMVMFQRAAGGQGYTGLVHRQHGDLDFTEQLAAGRAVLLGRIRSPATLLNTTDFPVETVQNWTYSRLLLPVSPFTSAVSRAVPADTATDLSP